MNPLKIPNTFRPGGYLKPCYPGIDLPAWFIDAIRQLDNKIYPIFHPYETLYEDIMNNYTGSEDDPRYAIHISTETGNQEIWGWPLKLKKNELKRNENWHLWRLCEIGWAHVFEIQSKDTDYLAFMIDELHFIAEITDKYGYAAVANYRREKDTAMRTKAQENQQLQFKDVMAENKGIMRKVMENYERRIIAPTNPTVETIASYSGQTNRSRIVRPLDDADKQSGLVLPPGWIN